MKTVNDRKELIFAASNNAWQVCAIGDELLRQATIDAGFDENDAALLFPGGINEFLEGFSAYLDHQITKDESIKGTTKTIHSLLWQRITGPQISKDSLKKILRYLSRPTNLPLATKLSGNTADHIWKLAGDRSVDMNYYSKRALLMPIYVRGLRFYAHDRSDGYVKTDEKITDLLANVLKIASVKKIFTAPKRFINMVKERI